jgi:glycine/D-amino acid oxidase-like deaminating enzyme
MQRRHFLGSAGASLAALSASTALPFSSALAQTAAPAVAANDSPPQPGFATRQPLAPVLARPERIIDVSVCTRPFRAQGPRIEAQRLGHQTIIHNYGHGGSGWSLSWGSAQAAVQLALATREKRLAVVGCGAIGLTTAVVAQRHGLKVRIYCKERPPEVRSSAATGVWSPGSRVVAAEHATPAFTQRWEAMARHSFRMYQSLLGLADQPVEWHEGYVLFDGRPESPNGEGAGGNHRAEPDYPQLAPLLADLYAPSQPITRAEHPFKVAHVRRYNQLVFNLPAYSRLLMEDFFRMGGEMLQREFASPRQFAGLRERTVVNATGYGARALLGDDSVIPVRGQTARLIPQPEVTYGLDYRGHNVTMVPRRDGLLVQAQGPDDFGSEGIAPDREASVAAVRRLAELFEG